MATIHQLYQALRFLRSNGSVATYRLMRAKIKQPKVPISRLISTPSVRLHTNQGIQARELYKLHFEACSPLRTFTIPDTKPKRVSLVTDSIAKGSIYGGVQTSIILSALLAEKIGARLRIITRTTASDAEGLMHILRINNIHLTHDVELVFSPFYDHTGEIDITKTEHFITTSWWTTLATIASVPRLSITYLLQEDERMFYAHSDDRLQCELTLMSNDIRYVVNSQLLYEHFIADGLNNIGTNGIWFEPAFPRSIFYPRQYKTSSKRILMFYARPNNLRNLFYFGINLLDEAITRGVIDLDKWDICLIGKDIPHIVFSDGYSPKRSENMTWEKYAETVGSVDVGLCLMSTPHTSYPPLDLAASGAVAVTNRYRNKIDLSRYSENIICGDLELESMMSALENGLNLSENLVKRESNRLSMTIPSDWNVELAKVIDWIAKVA